MNETDKPEETTPPREASLLQFLSGLAMQTFIHLGQMSNPMTGETAVDLVQARYSIDILGILQEKMAGNLTAEEDEYLRGALTQLRLDYVRTVEGAAADALGGQDEPPAAEASPS